MKKKEWRMRQAIFEAVRGTASGGAMTTSTGSTNVTKTVVWENAESRPPHRYGWFRAHDAQIDMMHAFAFGFYVSIERKPLAHASLGFRRFGIVVNW